MSKTYSSIYFPLSNADPAGIDQGLIPEEIETDQDGRQTRKYIGEEALKYLFRNLILTIPANRDPNGVGEGISDSDFGIGLTTYLFNLETEDFSSLKGILDRKIAKYILDQGYIKKFKTDVRVNSNQNSITVIVKYVPAGKNKLKTFAQTVSVDI